MKPFEHLFFGVLFSFLLWILFPQIGALGVSLIVFASVFIDVDHYLAIVIRDRKLGIKRAYNWHIFAGKEICKLPKKERDNLYICWCFFHGMEVIILLFLLGFLSKYFFFLFLGASLHLLLDLVEQTTYLERIDKFSSLFDFFKFRKLDQIVNI